MNLLTEPEPQAALKGTSKGSSGCGTCGSRWHSDADCPTKKRTKGTGFVKLTSVHFNQHHHTDTDDWQTISSRSISATDTTSDNASPNTDFFTKDMPDLDEEPDKTSAWLAATSSLIDTAEVKLYQESPPSLSLLASAQPPTTSHYIGSPRQETHHDRQLFNKAPQTPKKTKQLHTSSKESWPRPHLSS